MFAYNLLHCKEKGSLLSQIFSSHESKHLYSQEIAIILRTKFSLIYCLIINIMEMNHSEV